MILSLCAALMAPMLPTCTNTAVDTPLSAATVVCAPGRSARDVPTGPRRVWPEASLTLPIYIDGPEVAGARRMATAPVGEVAFLVQERRPELTACVVRALDRHVAVAPMSIVVEADVFARVQVTTLPNDSTLQSCIAAAFVDAGPTFVVGQPFRVEVPVEVMEPSSGPRAAIDPAPRRRRATVPDVCVAAGAPVAEGKTAPFSIELRRNASSMTQGRPLMLCSEEGPDVGPLVDDVRAWDACLAPAVGVRGTLHVSIVVDAGGTVRGEPKLLSQQLEGGQAEARAALPACVLRTLVAQRLKPRAGGKVLEVRDLQLRVP